MCYQCGNLGKAHTEEGTDRCEDCWRLDVKPRLETHANHVLPDPVKVREQCRLGETWISNYTTPHDIVQSAIQVGISTPNAFAKSKQREPDREEVAIDEKVHAEDDDMIFKKRPFPVHPKLISGKNSKREYKPRYRLPFMTRSEARKARTAAGLNGAPAPTSAHAEHSVSGPGPSTLAKATKKAHLAAEADLTMDTDTPVPASIPQQESNPTTLPLVTGISTTQEGSSQCPDANHPARVPLWAQMATSRPISQRLKLGVPRFIPRSAIQVKSLRHPQAKGPVHIPIWAREAFTQESLPTLAQKAAIIGASTADTISAKDQRNFAQPRYSSYDDMDLKPPCALKITLEARSYSKKLAAPITCNARGNSDNIIGMNYLKARQALHQLDPNRKLGWYTTRTVNLNTKAEAINVCAKTLPSIHVQSDNSRKRRASDDGLFEMLLRKGSLPADAYNKRRRIGGDSDEEFQGFSGHSGCSSSKSVSEATLDDLRAKAVSKIAVIHSRCLPLYRKQRAGFGRAPSLLLN